MLFETASWLEPITISRAGALTYTGAAAYAPDTRTVYLDPEVEVRTGDQVQLRGTTRRVVDTPSSWVGAGVTAVLDEPLVLAETGILTRSSAGGFNRLTNVYDEPTAVTIWAGQCQLVLVDQGGDADVAEQTVATQQLRLKIPAEVVDVLPDDTFTFTTALDPRIVGRPLTVTRIEGVEAGLRVLRVLDNQG